MNNTLIEEFFDEAPQISVLESEYKRLLGYPPDHKVEGRSRELMDRTILWYAEHGKPWIYVRQAETLELKSGAVFLEGHKLSSQKLHDHYHHAGVHSAFFAVVSAGIQCEEKARKYWKQGKPDDYFFMEMYGSAVAEYLISMAGHQLCALAEDKNLEVLPHYSPGYTGWDIADQITMMQLIQDKWPKNFTGTISMLTSGMLVPKKSLVGLFGIASASEHKRSPVQLVPCHTCALADCAYRRKPYRKAPRRIEQIN